MSDSEEIIHGFHWEKTMVEITHPATEIDSVRIEIEEKWRANTKIPDDTYLEFLNLKAKADYFEIDDGNNLNSYNRYRFACYGPTGHYCEWKKSDEPIVKTKVYFYRGLMIQVCTKDPLLMSRGRKFIQFLKSQPERFLKLSLIYPKQYTNLTIFEFVIPCRETGPFDRVMTWVRNFLSLDEELNFSSQ